MGNDAISDSNWILWIILSIIVRHRNVEQGETRGPCDRPTEEAVKPGEAWNPVRLGTR